MNFFIVFGKKHHDCIVSSYLEFYNEVRPHQALDNRPLTGKWPEVDDPLTEGEKIVCREKLGGLLRLYVSNPHIVKSNKFGRTLSDGWFRSVLPAYLQKELT